MSEILTPEQILAIDHKERGIPQAHEMARILTSHEALRASLAAVEQQWRCFHCDEVFTDKTEAAKHFGADEYKTPACRLSAGDVSALREMEALNRDLRADNERLDNDARLWHEAEADRKRRIGDSQWWFHLDCIEGEKLALQEQLTQAEALELALVEQARLVVVLCESYKEAGGESLLADSVMRRLTPEREGK